MEPRKQSRVRLGIEELENRTVPAVLAPIEVQGAVALLGAHVQVRNAGSAATPAHDRPFHLEESGAAVINPDGTISGSASGQATHLGAFSLHDTTTIIGVEGTPEGVILQLGLPDDLEDHAFRSDLHAGDRCPIVEAETAQVRGLARGAAADRPVRVDHRGSRLLQVEGPVVGRRCG